MSGPTRRPRVFVCRELPGDAVERLGEGADVEVWPGDGPPPPGELLRRARDADGILSLLTDAVNSGLMEASPRLAVVANYAVGHDNVDVASATGLGIIVTNTPGVLTESTADLAMALLLAAARRLPEAERYLRGGRWTTWSPGLLLGRDLEGATLGILGMGRIGTAVARRAAGFGMRTVYWSRTRRPDVESSAGARYLPLDGLLSESDFVSIHLPLTAETRHLVGARELGLMKPTAVLVNTARGPIVDEAALYRALSAGRPGAAALDVMEKEPIGMDNPLLGLPNVILIPHLGSATVRTRAKMAGLAVDNLLAALSGRVPPNPVNPEVLPRARALRYFPGNTQGR